LMAQLWYEKSKSGCVFSNPSDSRDEIDT